MNAPAIKPPLGQLLAARGLITQDQLHIALLEQRRSGNPLGKTLVMLGFVSEAVLREALSENLGQQSIDLSRFIADPAALYRVPKELAKRLKILPLALDADARKFTVAMADPNNLAAHDQLRQQLKEPFEWVIKIATESDIAHAIDRHYGVELSIDGLLHEIETGEIDWASLPMATTGYSQPVVRLIDALLADAVAQGASDIHFEPEQSFVRIRYRIDGVLRQIRALHRSYWPAMVVRLKVISGMNIAETRAPQDGRISLTLAGRALDFRVSAQPITWGENIVLRILDRQKGLLPLEGLGLGADNLARLRLMIARPEGLLLVTGPTGSGKTTTLYSILNHLNTPEINVMTLEDPVEYPLAQIRQTSLNEVVKMDFATGIRSMLRQDPDVILVGEIRDQETAEMAFRAAMTGHQVYSTLHTPSAIGAIARLRNLGIEAEIMAGNIIGIVAQRLVRKLCPHCCTPYAPDSLERRLLAVQDEQPITLLRAHGCNQCAHTGYRGRLAVMELLHMNSDLAELIAQGASAREITRVASATGFRPMTDYACRRVLQGETSLDEIARVVDLTGRVA
ncbi:MAG: secretion system protein [Proteobacteria bacterium]|nr:secretion system protein [Pseudomonadota bacterium]